MKRLLGVLLFVQWVAFAGTSLAEATNKWTPPFVSSKEVPVGAIDRCGPMCAPYSTVITPVGWAYVPNHLDLTNEPRPTNGRPDIFVSGKSWFPGTDQGLYLYKYLGQTDKGTPRFKFLRNVKVNSFDGQDVPPIGEIFQNSRLDPIYGAWYSKHKTILCRFNEKTCEFDELKVISAKNVHAGVDGMAILPGPDGLDEIVIAVFNGGSVKPTFRENTENDWRSDSWRPYTGGGKWRGNWPFVGFYSAKTSLLREQNPEKHGEADFQRASPTANEVLLGCNKISRAKLTAAESDLICGSHFGGMYLLRHANDRSIQLQESLPIVDRDGIAIRHPAISPCPLGYPNEHGQSDIIAGGECALYYYRFTGQFTSSGNPIYEKPIWVAEQDAKLHLGSLVSFDTGDFDGDGLEDIVAGSSEGYVYFSKNIGAPDKPRFDAPVALCADGKIIHIQQNYRSIQGPQEIRWGYTGAAIADWNEDGLPDLLLSSATSQHLVYLNIGTRTSPKLAAGRLLYCNDLDLYGTWRGKPGVAKLGKHMAYITTDEDDELHLYWKMDDFNLRDGGKLKMADGKCIQCNAGGGGGRGRIKIDLADWDGDGIVDMFVGTSRGGSIPDSQYGLPQSRKLERPSRKGIQVVYLKNIGSNEKPVFEKARQVQFRGKDMHFGAHESTPAVIDFKNPNGPDLLVGVEYGNILYFAHEDVTFFTLEEAPANN